MTIDVREILNVDAPAPPAPTRNLGLLRCDLAFLGRMLHVPDGHVVIAAQVDLAHQQVSLMIEGPTMPAVCDGHRIPDVRPLCMIRHTTKPVVSLVWPAKVAS